MPTDGFIRPGNILDLEGNEIVDVGPPLAGTSADRVQDRQAAITAAVTALVNGAAAGYDTFGEIQAILQTYGTAATKNHGTGSGDLPTKAQVDSLISTAVNGLVAGAPGLLDTLDELAAALGDDANFASTVTSALAGKLSATANLSDVANAATARSNLGAAAASHTHPQSDVTNLTADLAGKASSSALSSHVADTANPHAVTKTQVGLSNVLNEAQVSRSTGGTVSGGAVVASPVTLTDAATISVDATLGNQFSVTLGGNRTLGNPTGGVSGQVIQVYVKQDGTGGRTVAFDTAYAFSTDLPAPTLTATANALDVLAFRYRQSSGKWLLIGALKGFGDV